MPSTSIDYSAAHLRLNGGERKLENGECVVSTPFGLSILEIQGELNLPKSAPTDHEQMEPDYTSNFAKLDDLYDAFRFGRVEFDQNDSTKVVLFIGKSQRLLGQIKTLQNPLGVLRVPRDSKGEQMEIIDVIEKKIIFEHRPLPVM